MAGKQEKVQSMQSPSIASSASKETSPVPQSPAAATLKKIQALVEQERHQEAFDLSNRNSTADPMIKNARGVCLMRMRQSAQAVRVFRELNLMGGGITLRPDVPAIFKTNYATALFLSGNVAGCCDVLHELRNHPHPRVAELREEIAKWKRGLSLLQRLGWGLGVQPDRPVTADFVPGDFE
ncbi:MAG: hypothetical protein WD069_17195 [Planctomycetales bacterium]